MKKDRLKNFAVFSGIGIQMLATIYGGHLLGVWLDENYNASEPLYQTWLTLAAVFVSITSVIVQVTKMNK